MKNIFKIDRNQFLKGIFGAGTMAFFPCSTTPIGKHQFSKNSDIDNLIKVIDEQLANDGSSINLKEIDNLIYAFNRIKPTNHVELSFVVACSQRPNNNIVDEYIRRKKGQKPLLPDHPILGLEHMGLPNTKRILIFYEQIYSLIFELTGENKKRIYYTGNL